MNGLRRGAGAALAAGALVAGCATRPPWQAPLEAARRAALEGRARAAVEAQCEAIQKLDEVGESRRSPLTLAAIYHRFLALDAVRLYREADESGRHRMAALRALLAQHGEGLDLLELSFGLALRRDPEGDLGGATEGDAWVLVERSLVLADFLLECLRGRGGAGGLPADAAAAPLTERELAECLLAVTLARLACGHYATALDQAELYRLDASGAVRSQAEAARLGRESVRRLLAFEDRTAEFRQLLEEEAELFTGVIDRISLRPGVNPGTYPIDRDLVDPEPGFHFKEGHARVALAVGEVNAGNEGRAQRYFLEALRHLLWAGLCGRPEGRGRAFLADVGAAAEIAGGGRSNGAGPAAAEGAAARPGSAEAANQRTILDYLQSVFRNLRRLSKRKA